MKKLLVSGMLVLALSGCSEMQKLWAVVSNPVSKSDIAAVEVTLTEAIRMANVCLNSGVGPCGKPVTRSVIINDELRAFTAFKTLQEANPSDKGMALTALNVALDQLTMDVPKKQ